MGTRCVVRPSATPDRAPGYGHTMLATQVLRKGLSQLAATISTRTGDPAIAGIRLRAGRAGSGKGAASMVTDTIRTAGQAGATGAVMVGGDSACGCW